MCMVITGYPVCGQQEIHEHAQRPGWQMEEATIHRQPDVSYPADEGGG